MKDFLKYFNGEDYLFSNFFFQMKDYITTFALTA